MFISKGEEIYLVTGLVPAVEALAERQLSLGPVYDAKRWTSVVGSQKKDE